MIYKVFKITLEKRYWKGIYIGTEYRYYLKSLDKQSEISISHEEASESYSRLSTRNLYDHKLITESAWQKHLAEEKRKPIFIPTFWVG